VTPIEPTRYDLAVVGGGVAGLYAALCAGAEANVLVLTKGPLRSSASYLAQGGVAAATCVDDTPDSVVGGDRATFEPWR
jgi:L-aspartate oxidase